MYPLFSAIFFRCRLSCFYPIFIAHHALQVYTVKMKIILTFCCLLLSTIAMADSITLTIDNQSTVDFVVNFKGQDTTITPDINKKTILAGKQVKTVLTKKSGSVIPTPVGAFLLNPNQQRIGISVAPSSLGEDPRLIVTGCPFCEPTGTTYIKKGQASVKIYLERH